MEAKYAPLTREFEAALLAMDRLAAARLLAIAQDANAALPLLEAVVVPAMERIGQSWEQGRVALSQVYMSGRICEEVINSFLSAQGEARRQQPLLALAVLEDHHLLGKRMVYATLRAAGYVLHDYGTLNVAQLVAHVCADNIEVLLLSTLMLPSALRVAQVRAELERAGARVKIVVGGAPFRLDEQLWREVGADAMGRNASDVLPILQHFTGGAA